METVVREGQKHMSGQCERENRIRSLHSPISGVELEEVQEKIDKGGFGLMGNWASMGYIRKEQ